ncbi:MAG: C13 family peptidase [Pseudomonadota bacterium]
MLAIITLLANPAVAGPEPTLLENYRFERLWPPLQAPWYFQPFSIAVNQSGDVYFSSVDRFEVRKYSVNGQQISAIPGIGGYLDVAPDNTLTTAGRDGVRSLDSNDQRFGFFGQDFADVATAPDGTIYVNDLNSQAISRYSADGQLLSQFGEQGLGDGQFAPGPGISTAPECAVNCPLNLDIDSQGNIFVVDGGASRIQKFDAEGNFLLAFGTPGFGGGAGEFRTIYSLTVAPDGNVHVVADNRIQVFDPQGQFLSEYADFPRPMRAVAIDNRGFRFVLELSAFSGTIQVYDASGVPTARWTSADSAPGFLNIPSDIAVTQGRVFVADRGNARLQEFAADGSFTRLWDTDAPGEDSSPVTVAAGPDGNVYVAELRLFPQPFEYRIKHFLADGTFVSTFFLDGVSSEVEIFGMSVDQAGNLYAAYSDAPGAGPNTISGVQKFAPDGTHLQTFDFLGEGFGQSDLIADVAVDSQGQLHLAAALPLSKVITADAQGNPVNEFGAPGFGPGTLSRQITGITVDPFDNLIVNSLFDDHRGRINQFDRQGNFLSEYNARGFEPGQLNNARTVAFDSQGLMYVVERANNRIQVFSPNLPPRQQKAIIVAGGGPYPGNSLWDATRLNANFAYRAMQFQGLDKTAVQYLSEDPEADLDGNGAFDDVDATATLANLMAALDPVSGFAADADELVIYLVDHGGNDTFRMNETEILTASDLANWVDAWQTATGSPVTVIYDACQSGSFVDDLANPAFSRNVLASSAGDQNAYFVSGGALSFSSYFFTQIFAGADLQAAFDVASSAITSSFSQQTPQLNVDGEDAPSSALSGATIGNGVVVVGDRPTIGSVGVTPSVIDVGSEASIVANAVLDNDGIGRVWAVLQPPGFAPSSPDSPIEDLPTIDLSRQGVSADFSAVTDIFTAAGTYVITVNAIDSFGTPATPVVSTVTVDSPVRRKAIIVAGGDRSDVLRPAYDDNAELAYLALVEQGYGPDGVNCASDDCDDIVYLNPSPGPGVDGVPDLLALEDAVISGAADSGLDLVLYLVGPGSSNQFNLGDGQLLSAIELDGWLDQLQGTIAGTVVVVIDADLSGSFVDELTPPADRERIVITSTADDGFAALLVDGTVSFSRFFWTQALSGATTREAFQLARQAIRYESDQCQTPQLDDNANGVGNELLDGQLAQTYTLGSGVLLAGDGPTIPAFSVADSYAGEGPLELVVPSITSTGPISQVLALVNLAGCGPARFRALTQEPDGSYRGNIAPLFTESGVHNVAVYATDSDQEVSLPISRSVSVMLETPLFLDGFESP